MTSIIVVEQQSIFDLAIQQYGAIEGVNWIVEDNTTLNYNSNILPGMKLKIREAVISRENAIYFQSRGQLIATIGTDAITDFDANDFDANDFNV